MQSIKEYLSSQLVMLLSVGSELIPAIGLPVTFSFVFSYQHLDLIGAAL